MACMMAKVVTMTTMKKKMAMVATSTRITMSTADIDTIMRTKTIRNSVARMVTTYPGLSLSPPWTS